MCKWYKEMNCYILLSDQPSDKFKKDKISQRAQLESSFRNYASVFKNVKIVLHDSQAKDYYLNFPHLCYHGKSNKELSLSTLLHDATSDAIFVGHANLVDFPIWILADLIKLYNGELFMGYNSSSIQKQKIQFGIYNKSLISNNSEPVTIDSLDNNSYKLLPLPASATYLF